MANMKGHMAMDHAGLCVGMVHAQYTCARPQSGGLRKSKSLKIPFLAINGPYRGFIYALVVHMRVLMALSHKWMTSFMNGPLIK